MLDKVDRQILRLLQKNAKTTIKEIAEIPFVKVHSSSVVLHDVKFTTVIPLE